MIGKPKAGELVAIGTSTLGPALAVGRMILDGERIIAENITKGKAVNIIHTFKDSLWSMGSKSNPPDEVSFKKQANAVEGGAPQPAGALSVPAESQDNDDELPALIPGATLDDQDIPPFAPDFVVDGSADDGPTKEEEKFSMTAQGGF